ncbi:hypothetical protein AB0J52_03765 [Spirillospora sp. NPDC049652]
MAGFAVASLGCGLAQDAVVLVAGRVLWTVRSADRSDGVGVARDVVSRRGGAGAGDERVRDRDRVLGFVGGLVLSGPLVEGFGWRGVFFVTVPVGLVMAVLVTSAVGALVAAPALGGDAGWGSSRCLGALGADVVLLAVFLAVEGRHREPLVRSGLFRSGTLRAANLVSFASGTMSGGAYLLVTLCLQEVEGLGPVRAGPVVAPVGLLNLALGTVLSRLVVRVGLRVAVSGAAVSARLLLAVVCAPDDAGAGRGGVRCRAAAVLDGDAGDHARGDVRRHRSRAGLAGGVRQTSFQLGVALGVAGLVSFAAWAHCWPRAGRCARGGACGGVRDGQGLRRIGGGSGGALLGNDGARSFAGGEGGAVFPAAECGH